MTFQRTFIQRASDEEVLYSFDGVIIPAQKNGKILLDSRWALITDVCLYVRTISDTSTEISETIWVK